MLEPRADGRDAGRHRGVRRRGVLRNLRGLLQPGEQSPPPVRKGAAIVIEIPSRLTPELREGVGPGVKLRIARGLVFVQSPAGPRPVPGYDAGPFPIPVPVLKPVAALSPSPC